MDDDRFDEVIRDLPASFNAAPAAPLDEMWSVIEDAHFNSPRASTPARSFFNSPWLAAATLLIGIGLGTLIPLVKNSSATQSSVAQTSTPRDTSAVADAYRDQTHQYLGQAAALLISLPAKDASEKADSTFSNKAADLLVTTRLLIDSPAASQDPKLRSLLEDLELVLVQIARLRDERSSRRDLDLIHQAVEQSDVLSRLNSAVATTQSSE
ncbi:MAG TPA: hypothetical protein VJ852_01850 [Gemmatimonadaceae bacterium]|nr:hypothetical protein [Gemmatimonadaceae bacterium]